MGKKLPSVGQIATTATKILLITIQEVLYKTMRQGYVKCKDKIVKTDKK
jgi:DNA-binding transcriptional regulator YhcF (GntR family)